MATPPVKVPKRRGRPPKSANRQPEPPPAPLAEGAVVAEEDTGDAHVVRAGVTIGWLSTALGMAEDKVRQKLRVVPHIGAANGARVYNFRQVLPHLVDPIMDVEEYIRKMDPKNLPVGLTTEFWRAEKMRLQTLEMAQELWPTKTVLKGYAEIFKILRDESALWLDGLDDVKEMTDEQRRAVGRMIDAMHQNVHRTLVEFTRENATRSEIEYVEERLAAVVAQEKPAAPKALPDDDIDDLEV